MRNLRLLALALAIALPSPRADAFELKPDDRVVFLGNSFFERARAHGHIETALTLAWPDRPLTFRNLGWDGDTVFGHARAGGRRRAVFGDPEEGFAKMTKHIASLKPTVIFVAYGLNESFDGPLSIDAFQKGLERLLDSTKAPGRRFVLLSQPPMELGPDDHVLRRNTILSRYNQVIANVAKTRSHTFVDLFSPLKKTRYSTDGIHPSDEGYRAIAKIIAKQLKLPAPKIDLASAEAEAIRAAIVKKNTLYFHRWRPRNDAFVYGERKDEQKIAQTEPEQFEPFIAKQEKIIRERITAAKP